MPTLRRRLVTLLALASLLAAVPAPAVHAQGAGDEQYQDPFAPSGNPKPKPKPKPTTSTPVPSSGTAAPPAAAGTATTTSTTTAAAPAASGPASPSASSNELPRTGFDARPAAAAGVLLLLLGLVLRRRTRPEHR